ncbi:hypothetical protein [Halalkalicoccus salilacus]|uniref:hypothetical protein n=1 Tax=Halalkalicoccus salilacus TaxID=3117459 RepID=UPI00300F4C04
MAMNVERFVWLIVGGGIALIAGLWLVAFFDAWSIAWLAGAGLALLGAGSLGGGIDSRIEI